MHILVIYTQITPIVKIVIERIQIKMRLNH